MLRSTRSKLLAFGVVLAASLGSTACGGGGGGVALVDFGIFLSALVRGGPQDRMDAVCLDGMAFTDTFDPNLFLEFTDCPPG